MFNGDENIEEIINGCRNKDRKAQELLYRSYFRAMMTLCVRYTRNETDAMDVLNTGFYKVFKNIEKYDSKKAALYTWMRTIIINSCLSFIKSNTTRADWKELDQGIDISIEPAVFTKMSSADILQLVRQLPPSTQAVFNLYVMEGYSHKEIGSLLGISDNTSKWHLCEARRILQALINKR